jgi:hypothetical protein
MTKPRKGQVYVAVVSRGNGYGPHRFNVGDQLFIKEVEGLYLINSIYQCLVLIKRRDGSSSESNHWWFPDERLFSKEPE